MPAAIGSDAARRQGVSGHKTGIGIEHPVDDSAPAMAPLLAAALHAGIRKAESLFRSSSFMSNLDEEIVHGTALLQKSHCAIGLDDAEKDGAVGAFGTRAERRRRTARDGGLWCFHKREA